MEPLSVLLFDLGGVLVENRAIVDNLNKVLGQDLDEATIKERWLRSPAARDFELGKVAPETFAARFLEESGSSMEPGGFLADVAGWLGRPFPGAAELLTRLRKNRHVSCLSNCNELHWGTLTDFLQNFDSVFSSHLLGEIKPDQDAFRSVSETLGVEPAQVRFFDDVLSNVEAARRFGFRAFQTVGFEALQQCLRSEGLV